MKKRYAGAKRDYVAADSSAVAAKPNRLVWFLFGSTVGLFAAFMGLIYFSSFDLALVMKHSGSVNPTTYAHNTVAKKINPVALKSTAIASGSAESHSKSFISKDAVAQKSSSALPVKSTVSPKYEFYKMLKQEHGAQSHHAVPVDDLTETVLADGYYLKVGAFKGVKESDALKAELVLAGFNASLRKAVINGTSWTRVVLGPYATIKEAYAVQSRLKSKHYHAVLLPNDYAG